MPSSATDPVASVVGRVRGALERAALTEGQRPLVVAVSGGADSTCLLDAVVAALGGKLSRVVVGHVDHQLRLDSAEDAEAVRRLAASLGVRCETVTVDISALARAEHLGIEEAARIGRYRALSTLAREAGASTLLTGHTRSDSIETVLMHLLRGSGQRGLAGIAPSEYLDPRLVGAESALAGTRFASIGSRRFAVRVERPLLEVDRGETTAYCLARGLTWRDDPSNADDRMLRNRLRQHLLPVLRTYNPAIDDALARLAQTSRDEEQWLHRATDQRYRTLATRTDDSIAFDLVGWNRMPVALARRVARHAAHELDVRDVGFDALERALSVAHESGPRQAQLLGGLIVSRAEGRLLFQVSAASLKESPATIVHQDDAVT
jgi:tRNA(Ile)-lysidine synthetase-like protein